MLTICLNTYFNLIRANSVSTKIGSTKINELTKGIDVRIINDVIFNYTVKNQEVHTIF